MINKMMNLYDYFNSFTTDSFVGKYDCGNNAELRLFSSVSSDEFNTCISELAYYGFSEVQSNHIDNFSSYTFLSDGHYLVVSYDTVSHELRLIYDPFTSELPTSEDVVGSAPARLWQFEVDHSLIDCGMCYIVQCADYSFFIVDSAHTYSVNDDVRIYELLRKETPEDRQVRVRGWFLSHGHVDHIAKFLDILKYNKDIIIDALYYNFVPTDHVSSYAWMRSDKNHTELFNEEVAKRDDIKICKLHSGQYFYINGIRIDVLCTHEDVFPASLENYNDSSTVLMLTVNGDKVCFPGDAGGEESIILERRYPSFLKCDIMQVAHHGHFGTSTDFYKLSDADVALFATTKIKFDEEYPHYEANRVVCELAKHTFIASDGTVMFTFPLKNSSILRYPDETFESFEGVYNLWGYDYSDEFKKALTERFSEYNKFQKIKY